MKRTSATALCAVAMVLLSGLLVQSGCSKSPQQAPGKISLYERVLKAGKIRCSYCAYPPYCIKDPNTGKFSGIFVDVMEEIGRKLGLKIEWVEEVGWGTIFEGLDSDRYDVHGSGLWQNGTRGKKAFFSAPLFYNAIRIWVRAGDDRLKALADLNSPEVRVAVQDGAIEDLIARSDFPNAQRVSIAQLNPWTDNLLNITSKKADVTFAEPAVILPFLAKNPGTLRELAVGRPIRVFANSYPFKMGETEFKSMIDSAIAEIISEGTMDKILKKYENGPDEYLRVAPPYELPLK